MPSPVCVMSCCEYDALGAALSRRRGVELAPGMVELVSTRLWPRVAELGLSKFAGYVRYIESAARGLEELDTAWELISGARRELMAEPGELDELARLVLAPMIAARRYERRLRVWAPSCGRGAEAYSIALVALGLLGREASSWALSVVGSDVSDAAIDAARLGVFSAEESRRLSPSVRSAWFTNEGDRLRARGWLRERVRFEAFDARDRLAARRLDECDVVVMRGVLGAMDRDSRARVLGTAWERLAHDGMCVVGRGEALMVARSGYSTECGVLLAAARGVRVGAAAA